MRTIIRTLLLLVLAALPPSAAWAQVALAGTVKDASGAVLPGVTVEAASPVLIEKTRTAVSDATGQYRIESLTPGTYTVTVIVSDTPPTFRSALIVTTPLPDSSTPSRFNVENPDSVNVTV